jgi:hypothetical protein
MRSVPATLFVFVLLLMLVVTTPIGTGGSLHESTLLHPLFSHTHVVDGRVVTHQQLASGLTRPTQTSGPSLAPSENAGFAADALVVSPTLPLPDITLSLPPSAGHAVQEGVLPEGVATKPPDPPPTSWA